MLHGRCRWQGDMPCATCAYRRRATLKAKDTVATWHTAGACCRCRRRLAGCRYTLHIIAINIRQYTLSYGTLYVAATGWPYYGHYRPVIRLRFGARRGIKVACVRRQSAPCYIATIALPAVMPLNNVSHHQ